MRITVDILRAWRHPRVVMARRLAEGPREDRALAYLMIACVLIFVAQWPRMARDAQIDPLTPLDMRLGATLFAWLFIVPLALYAIAWISHLLARLLGGNGSAFAARMALFWSLLAVTPLWLLNGLVAGFIGPGTSLTIVGAISLAVFFVIWISSLIEAESVGKIR
jgi:nitrogen fixation/metabolism regulation signal transduction histidine kinase